MDINKKDNNLIVTGLKDFNLHHIFDCGQCFRFNAVSENSYFGIAKNKALLISQNDDEVIFYDTTEDDFKNIWYDYFDLNRDYSEMFHTVTVFVYLTRIYGRLLFLSSFRQATIFRESKAL